MDVAALRGGQLLDVFRFRELVRIVYPIRLASLRDDHFAEFFERVAVFEHAVDRLLRRKRRARDARETYHFHAELEDEFLHVFRTFAFEQIDDFENFQPRADRVPERLVRVRDERDAFALHVAGDARQRPRELLRLFEFADGRAVAPFDVHDETFAALGEFFGKNAARDQRERTARRCRLTECGERFVDRRNFLVLFHDGAADFGKNLDAVFRRELRFEAGNRVHLIDGGNDEIFVARNERGNDDARRRREHGKRDRRFVADAAGGNFRNLRIGNIVQIDRIAGEHHFLGKRRRFRGGHILEVNRHQQSRLL